MADNFDRDQDQDERVTGGTAEEIRGVGDDDFEEFDDADDLDEEEDEGSTTF
jgi:hypothetical protein